MSYIMTAFFTALLSLTLTAATAYAQEREIPVTDIPGV